MKTVVYVSIAAGLVFAACKSSGLSDDSSTSFVDPPEQSWGEPTGDLEDSLYPTDPKEEETTAFLNAIDIARSCVADLPILCGAISNMRANAVGADAAWHIKVDKDKIKTDKQDLATVHKGPVRLYLKQTVWDWNLNNNCSGTPVPRSTRELVIETDTETLANPGVLVAYSSCGDLENCSQHADFFPKELFMTPLEDRMVRGLNLVLGMTKSELPTAQRLFFGLGESTVKAQSIAGVDFSDAQLLKEATAGEPDCGADE